MILGAIILGLAWLVSTLLSVIPSVPTPDWLSSVHDRLVGLLSGKGVSTVLQFVPGGLILAVLGAVAAVIGSSFLIRFIRIGISHITGGGGAL